MMTQTKTFFTWIFVIVIIVSIAYFGGFLQVLVQDFGQINCNPESNGLLSCSPTQNTGFVVTGSEIGVNIFNNGNLNKQFDSVYKPILINQNIDPIISNFFKEATLCQVGGSGTRYFSVPDSFKNNNGNPLVNTFAGSPYLVSNIEAGLSQFYSCGYSYYRIDYYGSESSVVNKAFNNQLMVVDLSVSDNRNSSIPAQSMRLYGLCDMGSGNCIVNNTLNQYYSKLTGNSYTDVYKATFVNSKVYLKVGGYADLSDNTLCQTGLIRSAEKCDGSSLLVCKNNAFIDEGQVDGKCGYSIPISAPSETPSETPVSPANNISSSQVQNSTYNEMTNQTTIVYTNGSTAIVPGKVEVKSFNVELMITIIVLIITFLSGLIYFIRRRK